MSEPQIKSPHPGPEAPTPADTSERPRLGRIIFWLLLLYALGYALMVIEDLLNHTFI